MVKQEVTDPKPEWFANRRERRRAGSPFKTVRRPAKSNPMPVAPKKHVPYRKVQP